MRTLVLDLETLCPEHEQGNFPQLTDHQPLVLAALVADVDKGRGRITKYIHSAAVPNQDVTVPLHMRDQSMMQWLFEILPTVDRLVTWNGNRFDIPLIFLRSLKYELRGNLLKFRGNSDANWDMKDRFGKLGSRHFGLDGVSKMLGYPGKTDVDGSKVRGLWLSGEYSKVEQYCWEDVVHTYLVYLIYLKVTMGADLGGVISKVRQYFLEGTSDEILLGDDVGLTPVSVESAPKDS